jgi:hypothetical protein
MRFPHQQNLLCLEIDDSLLASCDGALECLRAPARSAAAPLDVDTVDDRSRDPDRIAGGEPFDDSSIRSKERLGVPAYSGVAAATYALP